MHYAARRAREWSPPLVYHSIIIRIIRGAMPAILTSLRILSSTLLLPPGCLLQGQRIEAYPQSHPHPRWLLVIIKNRRCQCSKKESNLVRGLHTNSLLHVYVTMSAYICHIRIIGVRVCVCQLAIDVTINIDLPQREKTYLVYAYFINCSVATSSSCAI